MNYHQHARLTVFSREQLAKKILENGFTLKLTAATVTFGAICGCYLQGELPERYSMAKSYRSNSWLDETGAPMKVQQESMRHASIQTTTNVYGQAMENSKWEANGEGR